MTPAEMVQRLLQNIEAARALIDQGPCGYVLHTDDHARFLCQVDDVWKLDAPVTPGLVTIRTYRSALVMRRYWNTKLPHDTTGARIDISLKGEALRAYIHWQQLLHDAMFEMAERRKNFDA